MVPIFKLSSKGSHFRQPHKPRRAGPPHGRSGRAKSAALALAVVFLVTACQPRVITVTQEVTREVQVEVTVLVPQATMVPPATPEPSATMPPKEEDHSHAMPTADQAV